MKWLPVLWFHSNCMQTWLQTSGCGFDWSTAGCVLCCLTLRWRLLIRNKTQVIHSSVILEVLWQEGLLVKLIIHHWVKWYLDKTITSLVPKCSNQVWVINICVWVISSKSSPKRCILLPQWPGCFWINTASTLFLCSADGDALWITLPVRCWWNWCGDGEKIFANELATRLDRVSAPSLSVSTFCLFGVADEILRVPGLNKL